MTETTSPVWPHFRPALWSTALIFALMLGASAWALSVLPSGRPVPVHWNARGEIDGYASPAFALLMIPATTLFTAAVLALSVRFSPRRENLLGSAGAINFIWIAVIAMLGVVHVSVTVAAFGRNVPMGSLMPALVGALLIAVGNWLPKVQSNFFVGVRTPWTLSSEVAWRKTNRLGGMLLVALGAAVIVSSFLAPEIFTIGLLLAGTLASTLFLVVFSYLCWKSDPNRT